MLPAVLRRPGVARPFVASLIARLPIGAMGLVFLLHARDLTGSYATGGAIAAANAVAFAAASPAVGRFMDRRGQTLTLALTAVIFAAAMTSFALLPHDTPTGLLAITALVAGASFPPVSPAIRALWADTVTDTDERHAAYSAEATFIELVYLSGPILIVGVIGTWSLRAAAIACGATALAGTLAMAAARASRHWRPTADRAADWAGALRGPGVRVLLVAELLFGLHIGAIELATAAFSESEGTKNAVGPLLGVWGVGSMLGGIWSARRPAPADPPRQLAIFYLLLAAACLPLIAVTSVVTLGAALLVAGFFIAPTGAVANGILGDVAPAGTVTEAFSWVGTAIGAGIALGAAAAGQVVENVSIRGALITAVVVVAGGALVVVLAAQRLRTELGHNAAP